MMAATQTVATKKANFISHLRSRYFHCAILGGYLALRIAHDQPHQVTSGFYIKIAFHGQSGTHSGRQSVVLQTHLQKLLNSGYKVPVAVKDYRHDGQIAVVAAVVFLKT